MAVSLRPFARSRSLRALGLMAWLMLVITSLAAAPAGMGDSHGHAMPAVDAVAGAPLPHGLAHRDHTHAFSHACCGQKGGDPGNAAGHACGCIGMCASAVPSMPAGVAIAARASRDYPQPSRLRAPSTPASPPLRPPAG